MNKRVPPRPLHKILVSTMGLVLSYWLVSAKEELEGNESGEVSQTDTWLIFHHNACTEGTR